MTKGTVLCCTDVLITSLFVKMVESIVDLTDGDRVFNITTFLSRDRRFESFCSQSTAPFGSPLLAMASFFSENDVHSFLSNKKAK